MLFWFNIPTEDVEFDRGRPLRVDLGAAGTKATVKASPSGIPSWVLNFSWILSRTSENDISGEARRRTIVSSLTALMVNVAAALKALVGLSEFIEEVEGDARGLKGTWNCPGGRFWNGLGYRSGVEMRSEVCATLLCSPAIEGRSSRESIEVRSVGS